MFNIDVSEGFDPHYKNLSITVDNTTVDFGAVSVGDLLEIVAEMEQELDVVKKQLDLICL